MTNNDSEEYSLATHLYAKKKLEINLYTIRAYIMNMRNSYLSFFERIVFHSFSFFKLYTTSILETLYTERRVYTWKQCHTTHSVNSTMRQQYFLYTRMVYGDAFKLRDGKNTFEINEKRVYGSTHFANCCWWHIQQLFRCMCVYMSMSVFFVCWIVLNAFFKQCLVIILPAYHFN